MPRHEELKGHKKSAGRASGALKVEGKMCPVESSQMEFTQRE